MSDVVWEDPGPTHVHRKPPAGPWAKVAEQLRARPGEWARIATFEKQGKAAGLARRFRQGVLRVARPAGSFEATSRTVPHETGDMFATYVRYVGQDNGGAS